MARKVHWQYIYVVRNENGEEIAEVSTLEAALAMVGGNPSGGDAGCIMELNNGVRQVRESQNDSEESSRDPNASSSEPHQEEPRPSAEPVIRIPRRRSSRRRRRTTLKFTLGQVEEMEKLFKETQYPDALARYVSCTRSYPQPPCCHRLRCPFVVPGPGFLSSLPKTLL
ncbi:homeobox protein Rhox13-like [Peromyscus californicus insignis]|uniref:homeobox protein Rhox13-like n=1 Tax=Peromyscus californicus insignis TaxID=564181 RepID=UPI0022A7CFFF|nr:homeobox protein Rhox13-like [Peromyscus californicus insignis]